VQARFLIGPAGSGKTYRCLDEIRTALRAAPDGPPLILLAPKQATFQLERQLLAEGDLGGFSRLHILSFDRLAQFVFTRLKVAPPRLLSAEGRLMVIRALLRRHEDDLKLFRASARRPGFAQELGDLLAELQQHQFTPAKLRALGANEALARELRDKLHDLALMLEQLTAWLQAQGLQDANCLLDVATAALRPAPADALPLAGLWLDGFAEMTPQELALLAAVVPRCEAATLAFCLETEPLPEASWLSIWSAIGKTFQLCRNQIAHQPGCTVVTEVIERVRGQSRFVEGTPLAELELNWSLPVAPAEFQGQSPDAIRVVECADIRAEATLAAREVLRFVRAGNRLRECAVLVRQLDGYHQALARTFRRYGIPFFLDRRESVTHHPLAELTRNALRTVAFDWQHDDWFAALKSGFSPVVETEIDRLENNALASGWRGKKWREPLPDESSECVRLAVLPPFEAFAAALGKKELRPDGVRLAEALRRLWREMNVEAVLNSWALGDDSQAEGQRQSGLHATVWDQMNGWLDNVALAFPQVPMPLRDWLPVLEAGLANLSVGVIPPVLDEVLIGAIDRARSPSLKLVLLLGMNEGVFPAPPKAPLILTRADREELEQHNVLLGARLFDQISRERYLGYIACTRPSERLVLSYVRQGSEGQTLNPSPFIPLIQRVFPALVAEKFSGEPEWQDVEHVSELASKWVAGGGFAAASGAAWLQLPAVQNLEARLAALREPAETENLSPALAAKLYGLTLRSSVSRLEEFAQCPFKFFVRVGLRANERKVFELDARERGNFQHDVLKFFHEQLMAEGLRWRDLTPGAARERIAAIAEAQMATFKQGLLRDSAETDFTARSLVTALQDFVEVIVTWQRTQNDFDPSAAEIGFGGEGDRTPAWELDLGGGRKLALQGRIDRVDVWRDPDGDTALAVVTDYKSGGKRLDSLLVEHGVQLQLLAYLGALRQWPEPAADFGAKRLQPAGAFYVNLRGDFKSGASRSEVLADGEARSLAYRHNGRFDAGHLRKFDRRAEVDKGDQFNFRLNKAGQLPSNSAEALPREQFLALVDGVETTLRQLGEKIFSGMAAVDPYRRGTQTPCEYCDYRAVCRLDEWTHEWRQLRAEKNEEAT
jgi:ATP-dependent helicase/nuclease subunit B